MSYVENKFRKPCNFFSSQPQITHSIKIIPSSYSKLFAKWNLDKFIYENGYVQSCLPIIFQYQPISLQYYWPSDEQPIRFWLRVYKLHEAFPIYEKIIPILTMCYYYRMDSAVLVDAGCRVVSMDICSRMVEFAQRNKQFLINQGGQRFYSWGNDLSSRYTIVEIEPVQNLGGPNFSTKPHRKF